MSTTNSVWVRNHPDAFAIARHSVRHHCLTAPVEMWLSRPIRLALSCLPKRNTALRRACLKLLLYHGCDHLLEGSSTWQHLGGGQLRLNIS
jgi:hypothetical protein